MPVLLFENDIIKARRRAVPLAYLPNKKIFFLLIFILLIFAGWFYFSGSKNGQTKDVAEQEKSPLIAIVEQTSQLDKDSDADGLKDWEELLWKTDPNKADTDNDGTNDNEEITLNRNPLKAGPNDKISDKEDLVAQEKAIADSRQNTMTTVYARRFMEAYLTLKNQKRELTDSDKDGLVKSLMDNIKSDIKIKDSYDISNIKIIGGQKANLEKYAREIKKILIDEKPIKENVVIVFNRLLKNLNDKKNAGTYESDAKKILDNGEAYKQGATKLVSIEAPDILAEYHLALINNLNGMQEAVRAMSVVANDPMKGLAGFELYRQKATVFSKSFEELKIILNAKDVFVLE